MFKRDQPLFSRPVLAAIIVVTMLAIWLLNLTAPTVDLTTPEINQWQTESGIPVTWVTQDDWQAGNKLTLTLVFQADTRQPELTATTLNMLSGPSLPLSTATINQRLSPLAANVATNFTQQRQFLTLTLSNQPQFLESSFNLFDTWLNQTQFKATALARLQRQTTTDSAQRQLLQQFMPDVQAPPAEPLNLPQVNQYLSQLKQHVSHIVVAGAIDASVTPSLQAGLNRITQHMTTATESPLTEWAQQPEIQRFGEGELSALYGAVGLAPLNSVEDWLALQVWARDMLETQKQRLASSVVQWQLQLAGIAPYATWQIQLPPTVLQNTATETQPDTAWVDLHTLPSWQDSDVFAQRKQQLLTRLATLSQTPEWWTQMGSRVGAPSGPLTLTQFAQDYSQIANSFTIEDYQQRIETLLRPSSRQEIQVSQ
ncbi:hypothetical protein [Marinomonas ostreistagni]|uniref:hypothetical protein n=1 Tax=Marinomonas ostreistagni TaxID=359209 RepID=UPI00194F9BAE|nr:hypothetical protein [Marinomonas ostreistagni]MBM6550540.1 hypothetical protein [Marinomonas ostreistagni]